MTYLETWRTDLKIHLAEFAPLAKEDHSINLIYGITAAAVLWGVRDAPFDDTQKTALQDACGNEKYLPHLMRAVGGWDAMTQLEAARSLSKRQRDSDELRDALNSLMGTFIEELFEQNMVQRQHIDISGPIRGGNIVIGGYQIVAGDMVIQYITQQKVRACPTAPKPPAHFAGRRDELNRLKEVLGQGQSVAITGIQGVGGIGKTALSLQLASEMSDFSAVLWASLGPNPNTGNQLIEWARHADPDFDPGQDDIDMLANRVQALLTNLIQEQCPGRVLLILDDIWEGDSVRVARILQKASPANSVSLITTRSQLVIAQLRSTRLELPPMTPADALQMLRNLLSDYPSIPDDTLLELAEVVGYHPLAMELAAGQVSLLERPIQEIDEQIERYRGGIPEGSPFRDIGLELGEDREDNLEVVLAFSYDSLTEAEQAYFRALGILAYNVPFDQRLCEILWETNAKPVIDRLRHRSMLAIAENSGWYQQHVLLRNYARALAKTNGEYVPFFFRYADFMIHFASQFNELPLGQWATLEPYFPHLHAVGDEMVAEHDMTENSDQELRERIFNLAWYSREYLVRRPEALFVMVDEILQPKRIKWLDAGIKCCDSDVIKAKLINTLGMLQIHIGDKDAALEVFKQALSLISHDTSNSDEYRYSIIANIGGAYHQLGEYEKALTYYEHVKHLTEKIDNSSGFASVLNNIGLIYTEMGDNEKALDSYKQCLPIIRQLDEKDIVADVLNNIGLVHERMEHLQEALQYYEEALLLRQQIGDKSGEGAELVNIGAVHQKLGDMEKAMSYHEQALVLLRQVGNKKGETHALNHIGYIHYKNRDLEHALAIQEQTLEIMQQIKGIADEALYHSNIATTLADMGRFDEAIIHQENAIQLLQSNNLLRTSRTDEGGSLDHLELALFTYHHRRANSADFTDMLPHLQRLIKMGDETVVDFLSETLSLEVVDSMLMEIKVTDTQPDEKLIHRLLRLHMMISKTTVSDVNLNVVAGDTEAVSLHNLGRGYFEDGDMKQALDYLEQALPLSRTEGNKQCEALTTITLGSIYEAQGALDMSLEFTLQALPLFQELEDNSNLAITLRRIGSLYSVRGDKKKALLYYEKALPIYREEKETDIELEVLIEVGKLYFEQGNMQQALDYLQQALSVEQIVGNRKLKAATLNLLGKIYLKDEKNTRQALSYYRKALSILQQEGERLHEGVTLDHIAEAYMYESRWEKATETCYRALDVLQDLGRVDLEAMIYSHLAVVMERTGYIEKGINYSQRAIELLVSGNISHTALGITVDDLRNQINQWKAKEDDKAINLQPQGFTQQPNKRKENMQSIGLPNSKDLMPEPFDWIEISKKGYRISKYPVTNAQYKKFVEAGGYSTQCWWTLEGWQKCQEGWYVLDGAIQPLGMPWAEPFYWSGSDHFVDSKTGRPVVDSSKFIDDNQPVVGVSWFEAVAFCLWLSDVTGEDIMLPTEDQWQYAAQGDDGRNYPWGNDWDSSRCNTSVTDNKGRILGLFRRTAPLKSKEPTTRITSVTAYETVNKSPFGVVDMLGNVWEWCLTDYDTKDNDVNQTSTKRCARGYSFKSEEKKLITIENRVWWAPLLRTTSIGFRIARFD